MRNIFRAAFALTISLLILCVGSASAELVIDPNYQLVSSIRVGRTAYDYTYQVSITNNGSDVQNVTAAVSSGSLNTTIIDSGVNFGDVAAGITVTGTDTFTIRQNRIYAFDPSSLSWDIQFELAALVIPTEGGEIQGEGEIVLIVPSGATDEPVQVTITALQEVDLGTTVPLNTEFFGGVNIDFGEIQLNDNLDISMPAPAGVPDGAEVYLAKLIEYAGQTMYQMVDTAIVENGIITSQDPAFPGVVNSGSYAFLLGQNIGWVEGQVLRSGSTVPGSVVTLSGGYWLDIADFSGSYSLPAWAGNYVVVAFDPLTGDHGEKPGYMPYLGASITTNVYIGESTGPIQNTIINGDFETGDLTGWQLSGSGEAVSLFGSIVPYEGNYMAKISTGSGAVGGTSSALEQSFTVPTGATILTINYNFVSAEYPEWVGSAFNDVFNASLHTPNGSVEIAFESVNTAAFSPAPGLFSWGETGWLTATVDVSQWAGLDDTLTFSVHDVGDTVVDTVTLLDEIKFENSDSTLSLISGQTVSASVSLDEWKYYKISTTSLDTQVSFDLTHLTADIDLYVRNGNKPTLTDYDCRPFLTKLTEDGKYYESETCVQNNSGENVWYVGVHGSKAGSYKLKAIIGSVVGWASDTGFKLADTNIRENVVALANAAVGPVSEELQSGQSVFCDYNIPENTNCWHTDIEGGDGDRMINAITVYHNWIQTDPIGPIDSSTIANMRAQFANPYAETQFTYTETQKDTLIDQIISQYSTYGTVPTDENETLVFMNIQKQCLEWAIFIAEQAGGARVSYGGSGPYAVSSVKIRPGMGFYSLSYHAAIIVDVRYDISGNPDNVRVAEANYGGGWVRNPAGHIPWDRRVENNRTLGHNDYTAINFDD